jgi:hypothetical protein
MNPRLLRPTGRFDPRSIGNLEFWLDASDSSAVTTVSGNVSEWRSKVGTGRNASQGTALNRPVYTTAGRNGRNTITFDGANDQFATTGLTVSQPFTICWVGISNSNPLAATDLPYICDGLTNSTRVVVNWNGNAVLAQEGRLGMFAGAAIDAGTQPVAYNAWSCVSAVFNGSNSRLRANGLQVASGNAGSTGITDLRLGGRFNAGAAAADYFAGDWGAFLVYSAALSNSQCLAVERYLGQLYSVSIP